MLLYAQLFCLCEESGYLYRFMVYTGKQDPNRHIDNILPEDVHGFSKSEKTVIFLTQPLLIKGHVVFMDNYYTSTRLYLYLHQNQTLACGTFRKNRVPREVRDEWVAQDGVVSKTAGPLLCLKFKDKKDVHMLTTAHDNSSQQVAMQGGRRRVQVGPREKPSTVFEYNKKMGAVDRQGQVIAVIQHNCTVLDNIQHMIINATNYRAK